MRVALDTNVLAYAEGVGDDLRYRAALQLLDQLSSTDVLLPAQTLEELFRVLTGKAKRSAQQARASVQSWADSFEVADSTWYAFQSALDLSADHPLPIWDALVLAVAAENRCRLLLSEGFQPQAARRARQSSLSAFRTLFSPIRFPWQPRSPLMGAPGSGRCRRVWR